MLFLNEFIKVKTAIANGATTIEGSKDMQRQFAAGIRKEIKVVKAYDENDSYVETYEYLEDINKPMEETRYTGRITYGGGTWYDYICGVADGYFEPNASAKPDVVYIICKPDGTPICVAGNGCGCSFPTPMEYADRWWKGWSFNRQDTYPIDSSDKHFEDWLLSYRDPADARVAKWLNEAPWNCYKENWIYNRGKVLERKMLADYEYMGTRYYLFRDKVGHEVCKVVYHEYFISTVAEPKEYDCWRMMGYGYNANKRGGAMSPEQARRDVQQMLENMYGKLDFSARPRDDYMNQNMLLITECEWAEGKVLVRSLPDYDVVDMILRNVGTRDSYNRREFIEKLAKERQELAGKLYTNNKQGIEKLAKDPPEITAKHCSYGVDDYFLPKDRRH